MEIKMSIVSESTGIVQKIEPVTTNTTTRKATFVIQVTEDQYQQLHVVRKKWNKIPDKVIQEKKNLLHQAIGRKNFPPSLVLSRVIRNVLF